MPIVQNTSRLDYEVPTPRMGLVGVGIDNKVYLIGGKSGPYEPATDRSTLFHVNAIGKLTDKKKMYIGHRGGFSTVSKKLTPI